MRTDLVDTFLLPSLVPAIRFLADYLWVDQTEQKAIIKVLQLILRPSAISNEASAMLGSVKKIIARPLDNSLQTYLNKRDPKNQDVTPLLTTLKDSIPMSRRTGWGDMSEVTEWCKPEPSGLWTSLKNTTQGLMQWAMQPGMNLMPVTYTHRQYNTGIKLMGPQRVLRLILEEIRLQTRPEAELRPLTDQQNQISGVVHDVATALVCAPNVTNEPPAPSVESPQHQQPPSVQRLLVLRDVLKLEAEKCREIQKTDPVLAEIVVRLHRRVEAQMVLPQAPPGMLPAADMGGMDGMQGMQGMEGMGGMDGMDGMDMTGNAEVSLDAIANMQGDPSMGMDMSLDLSGAPGLGDASLDNVDADLFGGLDTGLDGDLGDLAWAEGMDLS